MRELTREESDKFNVLWSEYGDWSIAHECMQRVRPNLVDGVEVESVKATQIAKRRSVQGAKKKVKWDTGITPAREEVGVSVKLSNGALISITLQKVYSVKSVVTLAGWEQTMPKIDAKPWFVYVVRCSDDSLYCGTTTDVTRRVGEHNTSTKGAKYTRSRRPVTLVKSWLVRDRSEAVKAEMRFKALSKSAKEDAVRAHSDQSGDDSPRDATYSS